MELTLFISPPYRLGSPLGGYILDAKIWTSDNLIMRLEEQVEKKLVQVSA
jgi:hypothetical protein